METVTIVKVLHKYNGWERLALVGNYQTRYGLMVLARNALERWDYYDFKTLTVVTQLAMPVALP